LDKAIINSLKKNGFASGLNFIFTQEERKEFESLVDKVYENNKTKKDYSSNAPVVASLLGQDPKLDHYFERVLSDTNLKSVLIEMLGENFRIWEISVRVSEPGDKGLELHQDAWGQLNIVYALNDQVNGEGATNFISGSHFLPRLAHCISWKWVEIGSLFSEPLKLIKSDYALFINKTWHGRNKNKGNLYKKIILIACFPNRGQFKPMYNQEVLDAISPDCIELKKKLDFKSGVIELGDGLIKVDAPQDGVHFTGLIEEQFLINVHSIFASIKVFALELIFAPPRYLFRLIRNLKKILVVK